MGDEEKRAAVAAADLFTSTATRSRTAVLAFTQEELHARRLGTAHERLAMTTQLLSPSFIPATLERPSFWRRWGDAFEAT